MEKISFIIPVYNVEKYIDNCMKSIVSQTLFDIEIICIDDCSMDSSAKKIREWSKKDNRIKVFYNRKNRGLSYTRNKGIKKASGEYIWFVDPDDCIIGNQSAEILYEKAKADNLEILLFDVRCRFENDTIKKKLGKIGRRNTDKYTGILKGNEIFSRQMLNEGFISAVPLYLFKTSWIKKRRLFFEPIIHEDMLFSVEALFSANRVEYIEKTCYEYYRRANSITSTEKIASKKVSSCAFIIRELHSLISKKEMNCYIRKALAVYFSVLKHMLHEQYLVCCKNGWEIVYKSSYDQFITELVIEEKYPLISPLCIGNLIESITNNDSIIVYGAGDVSKSVQLLLNNLGIYEYKVAVTSYDAKEKNVELLKDLSRDALVIIAAYDAKKDMNEYAQSIGYKKCVLVN